MSDLRTIVERDIVVTSTMMKHESGTKFYEVLLLQSQPSDAHNPLCMTRWGSINKQERGGTWGKGKSLNPRRPTAYTDRILYDKNSRGYTSADGTIYKDSQAYNYLLRLGFFDLYESSGNVYAFLRQFDVDQSMLIGDITPIGASLTAMAASAPIITRHPMFGSWS